MTLYGRFVARTRDDEEGFTLIELMVVVLIIAILIAIAIPTFLGARARAQDRAAQSDLRNGLTAEKTVYTDAQTYDATTANMKSIEASLNWNGATAGKPALNVVVGDAVTAGDKGVVCLSEASKSGTTFSIGDVAAGPSAGTYFGKAACPAAPTPANISALGSSW
jgi:type IV pilus assembly protein PilA